MRAKLGEEAGKRRLCRELSGAQGSGWEEQAEERARALAQGSESWAKPAQ